MKTLRLVTVPTRYRRLNEILGLTLVVLAALLLLALASYSPADRSFDTEGSYLAGRQAHNWTGVAGAWLADAILQLIGVAAFLLPLVLGRLGVCWLRSRPAGSPWSKAIGLVLWVIFAPAAIALLPGNPLWRGALPIAGVTGRLLADTMVQYMNLPGALMVLALMVVLSLYLTTTFSFNTAREWATMRFGFLARMWDRWSGWRENRRAIRMTPMATPETEETFVSKRERANLEAQARESAERRDESGEHRSTLLGSIFGWLSRRRKVQPIVDEEESPRAGEVASVWASMPRTLVDAPPPQPLSVAAAAAAPYAEALARAASPVRAIDEEENFNNKGFFDLGLPEAVTEPVPAAPPEPVEYAAPPAPSVAEEDISFGKRADAGIKAVEIAPKSVRGYKLPSSSLLYRSEEQSQVHEDALREEARVLVAKCAEFGVDGQVTQINPGPVVTTFEFKPDAGVKYSRVTGLADDLCLAMAAESILIERLPGKNTVGIQVPNHDRETIWLRDVIECEDFAKSKSRLPIALGKDINGRIVTADLSAMPHILIAGSTGSGKSVAINAMIMSVLFRSAPEQVRMILVDPKRVELGMYEGIPHLFTPIITDAKLAANALSNAVREMERRLKLLAANHVRNIDQFNKLFENGNGNLFEEEDQKPLPYIMIIIDELADLMMLDGKNVEASIQRLAQMARAVGIHLVLATQRPSVDVITGLIKANVPTRMSFRLATKVDSRTIIDANGAESLLGRGDMLYLPPGSGRVQRVHAPFVTEKEIEKVTKFWKDQGGAEYVEGFLEGPKDDAGREIDDNAAGEDDDPMFNDAVRLVFEFGKASTSLLQRRLRIGYGRAAHLIDMMYADGLVGPADGSKPRELLKSPNWLNEVNMR
ncbi:MAG: DNA translocase FtsK [Acidobacteriaceae bacterium]|nr:DNA translocase FtsK [Acidobacteriaceae bacterium]